ncbi:MAG: hypothetical protein OXF43_01965 [Gammaproteobacteria bacterium]|nr:hypothetical protein [Gammaproteobacteria bacterium]
MSSRTPVIALALLTHPLRRVVVPLVASVCQAAKRSLDFVPAALVVEAKPDQFRDKRASSPRPSAPVDLGNELIVQCYVYAHVPRVAHN